MAKKKNPAAVALGRLGGKKGGKARMESMTAEERQQFARMGGKVGGKAGAAARAKALSAAKRKEIARKAAAKRWGKKAES